MTAIENIEDAAKIILPVADNNMQPSVTVIPVVHESFELGKETVETNKIRISKKVTEQQTEVAIPLTSEAYEINRVPINQVVLNPPEIRHEGDTMIIPVVKEVLIVEKRFEIIEEIHIIKRITEKTETQYINLRQEEVQIERTPVTGQHHG